MEQIIVVYEGSHEDKNLIFVTKDMDEAKKYINEFLDRHYKRYVEQFNKVKKYNEVKHLPLSELFIKTNDKGSILREEPLPLQVWADISRNILDAPYYELAELR